MHCMGMVGSLHFLFIKVTFANPLRAVKRLSHKTPKSGVLSSISWVMSLFSAAGSIVYLRRNPPKGLDWVSLPLGYPVPQPVPGPIFRLQCRCIKFFTACLLVWKFYLIQKWYKLPPWELKGWIHFIVGPASAKEQV